MMDKLISIIVPSRNLKNLSLQFDHFEETTADLNSIEFLIKLDTDHEGAKEFIEDQVKKRKFTIKYILTPRLEGTFSLWIGIEQLFTLVSPTTYFVQIMSDEPYYLTPHWDLLLRNYIHFFKDDVFRLRLSSVKYNNYISHYECAFRCDSFPIYTKKWLDLTEGTGDCWGSDAYQQLVAYHLALGPSAYFNFYREHSYWRDIPIHDIAMGGLDFGVGVDSASQVERHYRNLKEWRRLSTFKMQERFSYLARRLYCAIWAYNNKIEQFRLVRDAKNKNVIIIDHQGKERFKTSYKIQRIAVIPQNILRDIKSLYHFKSSRYLSKYIPLIRSIIESYHNTINNIKKIPRTLIKITKETPKTLIKITKKILSYGFTSILSTLRYFFCTTLKISYLIKSIKNIFIRHFRKYTFMVALYQFIKFKIHRGTDERALNDHNERNEIILFKPPGIDVLYKNKYHLPPGIKTPTTTDIHDGKMTINFLNKAKNQFRDMIFKSNNNHETQY